MRCTVKRPMLPRPSRLAMIACGVALVLPAPAAAKERGVEGSIIVRLTPPSQSLPQTDRINLYVPERFRAAGARLPHCTAGVLHNRGVGGCPKRSIIGGGSSIGYTILGSQFVEEPLKLTIVNGPRGNLLTWVEGRSPVAIEEIVEGVITKPHGYGQELAFTIPHGLLEPLPGAPGWLQSLNAHISARSGWLRSSSCPPHGWSLKAEFGYTNGQTLSVNANLSCV